MLPLRVFAACLIAAVSAGAQPASRGVAFGHVHLNSADPAAAIAFWTDIIGAAVYTRESTKGESLNGVSMIGGMILFARGEPTATSVGSAIDHIAIRVPDLQPYVAGLAKTRYKVSPVAGGGRLMIDGPDGARIELIEDDSMYARLEFDHIHFFTPRPKETQAWYGRIFGARPGTDELANTSRVQGAVLTFSAADSAAPTAGRAIDHIAFEIKDLETFCRSLEAQGIKLDSPYKKVPELGMASAFLTDPWGTRIELTEGLGR